MWGEGVVPIPALFARIARHTLKAIKLAYPQVIPLAYSDDTDLIGPLLK